MLIFLIQKGFAWLTPLAAWRMQIARPTPALRLATDGVATGHKTHTLSVENHRPDPQEDFSSPRVVHRAATPAVHEARERGKTRGRRPRPPPPPPARLPPPPAPADRLYKNVRPLGVFVFFFFWFFCGGGLLPRV